MRGRHSAHQRTATPTAEGLVEVHPVEDLDETWIGLQVMVTAPAGTPTRGACAAFGGISDLELLVTPRGVVAFIWMGGRMVVASEPAVVVVDAPPHH